MESKATQRSSLRLPDSELVVHLVEDRRATISPWGRGNSKIGPTVFTYSKLPGRVGGTCPGSSPECEMICYVKRVVTTSPPVWDLWTRNTLRRDEVPPLPEGAETVRFHVSGDFDTVPYIVNWCKLVNCHPDVAFFGYTRSWRVPELLPWLTRLHDYRNVQLFASVDKTIDELPPDGWRRAWLETDPRAALVPHELDLERQGRYDERIRTEAEQGLLMKMVEERGQHNFESVGGARSYVCPEETGRKPNCTSCNYCITGQRGDVIFLEH